MTVPGLLGSDDAMYGRGGFARTAFLIRKDDYFHESDNNRIIFFMIAIFRFVIRYLVYTGSLAWTLAVLAGPRTGRSSPVRIGSVAPP